MGSIILNIVALEQALGIYTLFRVFQSGASVASSSASMGA